MTHGTYERVMRRLLRESAFGKVAGLGAIVKDFGDRKSATLYDTNMLIDYLRYDEEFIDAPHDMKSLQTRPTARAAVLDRVVKGYISIKVNAGSCHDAAVVELAAGPGYGKELYGMGYALSPNGRLAPDRGTVSSSAQAAWKSAADKGRSRLAFDDIRNPKTPPKEDDCHLHRTSGKEHLNYAYESEGWEKGLFDYLVAQHDATIGELTGNPATRKEIENLIVGVAANEFWSRNYRY